MLRKWSRRSCGFVKSLWWRAQLSSERLKKHSREKCARSWWKHYIRIPGVRVEEKAKEEHFARLLRVVNSYLGLVKTSVVWTEELGARCDEHCEQGCVGRHTGLAVAYSGVEKSVILQQLSEIMKTWTTGRPNRREAEQPSLPTELRWFVCFLDSQNNTVRLRDETAFMIGLWGFAEHSCAADGIKFELGDLISDVDCHFVCVLWSVSCKLRVEGWYGIMGKNIQKRWILVLYNVFQK
jgi:hypothetical protein